MRVSSVLYLYRPHQGSNGRLTSLLPLIEPLFLFALISLPFSLYTLVLIHSDLV